MEDAAGLKLIHPTLISIDRSSCPCIKSELRLLGGIILLLRRLELVDSLQDQFGRMGRETREHAEQIDTVTELLFGRRSKLIKRRRIKKKIGIPEIRVDKGLKV